MSADLFSNIPSHFDIAKSSGDLIFYPSAVNKHVDRGVEFEIRLCPALQKKPGLPNPNPGAPSEPVAPPMDPFAPPYTPNLLIGECRDEEEGVDYVLLLNKYSVVPHHIILATKDYQSQASPLFPCDLVQAYLTLLEAQKAGRRFIAFYNCGDNSGASQAHKHIQLIPLQDGVDAPPIERLAKATALDAPNTPFTLASLPYANHVCRLPRLSLAMPRVEMGDALSGAFASLLELAISTVRHDPDYPAGSPSYNVVLTLEHMHVIPRRHEAYVFSSTGQKLPVNALGFSGMLLVKSEQELQAVKDEGVCNILRGVALESVHDLQTMGTSIDPNPEEGP